jgi:hypothetical protein
LVSPSHILISTFVINYFYRVLADNDTLITQSSMCITGKLSYLQFPGGRGNITHTFQEGDVNERIFESSAAIHSRQSDPV